MTRRPRPPHTLAAALAALLAAACGSTSQSPPPWHLLSIRVPPTVAGFNLRSEPVSAGSLNQAGGPHSLIDGAAVFSLRQASVLYGVLQVSEFVPSANPGDPGFQRDVAGQLGQRVPRPVQVRNRTVYEGAAANEQSIYTWFNGRRMMILLVHAVRNPDVLLGALLRLPL